MFNLLIFILETFTSSLRPPSQLGCLSIQFVIQLFCALWGSIPHADFLLLSVSLATSNLVYVLWPDGPYYSPHITAIQGLPVAYKIQIPDPGILGIPRADPSLHFQLSPTTPLLVKLNRSIQAPWFLLGTSFLFLGCLYPFSSWVQVLPSFQDSGQCLFCSKASGFSHPLRFYITSTVALL